MALQMSIVEYPSLLEEIKHALIINVQDVVLDGGVYNQSSFATFEGMFVNGSIFDGGKP
jgi:hypothetical protein